MTRFGDESARREQVAQALYNKGVALRKLGHAQDAVEAYDQVVARFGDAPDRSCASRWPWHER